MTSAEFKVRKVAAIAKLTIEFNIAADKILASDWPDFLKKIQLHILAMQVESQVYAIAGTTENDK
jgi:hypothetical protein